MTVAVSRLKNGLTVATESRPYMQSIALGLWVKAGSRNERENQHGIAHLLEHMAFKGTKTRTALEIASAIENAGGDINAATGIETTGYFIRILEKDLPLAVNILSDIITAPIFSEAELAREKQVILQEIGASDDTPDDVVFDQLTETAYPKQSIGRPILGTPETVRSFSPDDLRAFMAEHYYGGNMAAVACGAVEHEDFLKRIEQSFTALPAAPKAGGAETGVRYQGGDSRKSRELMDTQILLGFRGCSNKDEEFYATHILSMILGGGMSSRLFQEVREKHGLCYSIYAFFWAFADTGLFGVHTATDEKGLKTLFPVLTGELKRAAASISQSELDRARAQYEAGLIMGQENAAARAASIARQILLHGRVKEQREILDKINAVTAQDIERAAQKLFIGGEPSLAAIGRIEHLVSYDEVKSGLAAA